MSILTAERYHSHYQPLTMIDVAFEERFLKAIEEGRVTVEDEESCGCHSIFIDDEYLTELNASFRKCDICGKEFSEGFMWEGGLGYYCSEECRRHDYTDEEYEKYYDDGNGDFYWTDFH